MSVFNALKKATGLKVSDHLEWVCDAVYYKFQMNYFRIYRLKICKYNYLLLSNFLFNCMKAHGLKDVNSITSQFMLCFYRRF